MEGTLLDPTLAEVRVEFGMVEAEFEVRSQWRAAAGTLRAIDKTLREAEAHPEVFIDAAMLRGDQVEFAIRAAVCDLAVRLCHSESTVRTYGAEARTLQTRLPLIWAHFSEGDISTPNAREAAGIAAELSEQQCSAFEQQILGAARTQAPARFRTRARALRDRLQTATAVERHALAKERRGVWSEVDPDGMGWLHVFLPAEDLARVRANVDGIAFGIFTDPEESRTMAQLRADTVVELLTGARSDGDRSKATTGFTVALTVPVLSLLGCSTEPAVLEGVGPIDLDTARRLTEQVPSLTRLLTDPITGSVLTMDMNQYRPPAALRRWLALTQVTCDFPGCGRRATHCDLDHTVPWSAGGATTAANLVHRCRKHHTMKHQTKWRAEKPPGAERSVWVSPTGYQREADPPPF
jgi:hypothetical protein